MNQSLVILEENAFWVLNQNAKNIFPFLVSDSSFSWQELCPNIFFSCQERFNSFDFFINIENSLLNEKKKELFLGRHKVFGFRLFFFREIYLCFYLVFSISTVYWRLLVSVRSNYPKTFWLVFSLCLVLYQVLEGREIKKNK